MSVLLCLKQDPVYGPEWQDIEFKAAVDCLADNGLKTPAQLANVDLKDLAGSNELKAALKGVLRRALERATTAGKQDRP